MRKRDIKRMLKAEIEQNVPFVLPEVLKTPCKIEDVVECVEDSPQTKPYFQFRYLYASLVVFAIMVVALGSFVPDTKRGGLMAGQVQENYIVTTTIQVENASAIIKSNENGKVQSVVINGVEHIWIANCTIEESIEYVIELLDSNLNINTIMVELDSTKLFNKETDFEHIKQLINIELENVEASARV
jgi:hypothetical protein